MLRCSISNAVPTTPVVGTPTGLVYERSIVLKAIAQDGKCPVTGLSLSEKDLVPIKTGGEISPPRSLDGTSIPSLLAAFQNEWDAMALETFKLRQLLDKTRKELAQALYQHDAACRVIARLSKERDEARGALATIAIPASQTQQQQESPADGDGHNYSSSSSQSRKGTGKPQQQTAAEVVPLSTAEVKQINELATSLQGTRSSKRKSASGVADELKWKSESLLKVKGSSCCLDLDDNAGLVAVGTKEGNVTLFNRSTRKSIGEHSFGLCRVSRVRVMGDKTILAACSDSRLRIVPADSSSKAVSVELKGAATDCCSHPSKAFALVADQSGTWTLVRTATGEIALSSTGAAPMLCIESHPDGKLFATAGSADGAIDVWDVTTGQHQAKLKTGDASKLGPVTALSFSENGISLAAVHASSGVVSIWDMRKPQEPVHTFTSKSSSKYCSASFDPTGQGLLIAAQDGSFEMRTVQRTGTWPVAFEAQPDQTGLVCAVAGRGSALTLASNGIVHEWK